jgi:ribosomal protein S12 methylthiotransferase
LDRVGCFEYSPVEGAAANALKQPEVPAQIKAERRARFMELAADISAQRLREKIGRRMRVLIDAVSERGVVARSPSDAPEIDGTVKIVGAAHDLKRLVVGSMPEVEITASGAYDLEAKLVA